MLYRMKTPRVLPLLLAGLLWLATKLVASGETPGNLNVNFTVTPTATGEQLVRTSLPLPRGFLGTNQVVILRAGQVIEPVGLRVLSWCPATNAEPRTARRAQVTFCRRFASLQPVACTLKATNATAETPEDFPVTLSTTGESLQLAWKDGRKTDLRLVAPPRTSSEEPSLEIVETNRFYRWQRLHFPDAQWPRVVEARVDRARSSAVIISQGLEHAWQLTQAARALGPDSKWLDAIEIVLRARILGWQRTGMILSGLEGWEVSTGKVKDRKELYGLYRKPADRDASRDCREGRIGYGSAPPEGLVYFEEVLAFYLQHRDAARLLAEPKPDEPLGLLLARSPEKRK